MYLQNIMSNYLNENVSNFSVENQFKPLKVKKDTWEYEEKINPNPIWKKPAKKPKKIS